MRRTVASPHCRAEASSSCNYMYVCVDCGEFHVQKYTAAKTSTIVVQRVICVGVTRTRVRQTHHSGVRASEWACSQTPEMSGSSSDDDANDGIGENNTQSSRRVTRQPIGSGGGGLQQRPYASSMQTGQNAIGVPVLAPNEQLMRQNPYATGGAIGTSVHHHHRTTGGTAAPSSMRVNHTTELPTHFELRSRTHGGATAPTTASSTEALYNKEDVSAIEMDDMSSEQHNVLAHVFSNSPHDSLRPTEENIMYSRRFYIYPDHSFFNACMLLTVIAALMAFSTAFVSVIVNVCQIEVDLYWYRTVYVVMAFVIGLALVAITMLHIYRHRSFSKNHVISITMPAIVFIVGSVMCGFGLQWYVSTHGSTIHWHSAAQMSALSNILLMNFAWGIAMVSITARALGCHWVAEQIAPQTTVELAFTKDDVQASATFRSAARVARVGMGDYDAGGARMPRSGVGMSGAISS